MKCLIKYSWVIFTTLNLGGVICHLVGGTNLFHVTPSSVLSEQVTMLHWRCHFASCLLFLHFFYCTGGVNQLCVTRVVLVNNLSPT